MVLRVTPGGKVARLSCAATGLVVLLRVSWRGDGGGGDKHGGGEDWKDADAISGDISRPVCLLKNRHRRGNKAESISPGTNCQRALNKYDNMLCL